MSHATSPGPHVVVTAGGTREQIDPIRYLSNHSSGKMGFALAQAAAQRGAQVTLITTQPPPPIDGVDVVSVESAAQMQQAVQAALRPGSVLLMAAAVADYRPAQQWSHKIKKHAETMTLELVRNPDILATVTALPMRDQLFVVGFAAETDDPVDYAVGKLRDKHLDLIVLNDVSLPGIGMGADDNAVSIIDATGVVVEITKAPKLAVAQGIVDAVWTRWFDASLR